MLKFLYSGYSKGDLQPLGWMFVLNILVKIYIWNRNCSVSFLLYVRMPM